MELKQLITPVIILIASFIIATFFNRIFLLYFNRRIQNLKGDPTNYKFLRHAISAVIYLVVLGFAIHNIPTLKAVENSLLAGAGIAAVAIGLASQAALSNIITGVFLVLFKPFSVGDRIDVGSNSGFVEDITLRHTILRNLENKRIIIPNSIISSEVIVNSNLVDDKVCKHIIFGISYSSNIELAKQIIREEALNHTLTIDARTPLQKEEKLPIVDVRAIELADSSVNIKAWVWAENLQNAFTIQCDMIESVKKRFEENNIDIPFPHRTIIQKSM